MKDKRRNKQKLNKKQTKAENNKGRTEAIVKG